MEKIIQIDKWILLLSEVVAYAYEYRELGYKPYVWVYLRSGKGFEGYAQVGVENTLLQSMVKGAHESS